MANILFIKTSSLGDVVHHMPALTEARRQRPDATFSWLVEEAFAPLVALHPAVGTVVPVAWRRWRKSLLSAATRGEIRACFAALRDTAYDEVIDTQGLLRTGVMTGFLRGRKHGYGARSIREPLASLFYDVKHTVSRELHAVDRNRMLTGLALGYTPEGQPDFGLDRARFRTAGQNYAVLLHATARPEKEWPEAHWIALGQTLAADGLALVLPWGTERERARAERLAAALPNATVPPRAPLDQVATLMAGATLVVGVDTGLLHLAAAFAVPLVAIFVGSKPRLTAPVGAGPLAVLGEEGAPPSVKTVRAAVSDVLR